MNNLIDVPVDAFNEWNCLPLKLSSRFVSQITGSLQFVTREQALTELQP